MHLGVEMLNPRLPESDSRSAVPSASTREPMDRPPASSAADARTCAGTPVPGHTRRPTRPAGAWRGRPVCPGDSSGSAAGRTPSVSAAKPNQLCARSGRAGSSSISPITIGISESSAAGGGTPDGGSQPGRQFRDGEGLGDVVVSPRIKRLDLVRFPVPNREHQDLEAGSLSPNFAGTLQFRPMPGILTSRRTTSKRRASISRRACSPLDDSATSKPKASSVLLSTRRRSGSSSVTRMFPLKDRHSDESARRQPPAVKWRTTCRSRLRLRPTRFRGELPRSS